MNFWKTVLILFGILSLSSCNTLVPLSSHEENSFTPKQRFYYAQANLIDKVKFSEKKAEEISVKEKEEEEKDYPMEELSEIHENVMSSFASLLLQEAETYLGTPYRYGGTTRRGIDCSAFVQNVFEKFDYDLPRVSSAQAMEGVAVAIDSLKEGDLLFFTTRGRGRVSHVGIVHGFDEDGTPEFIHASSSRGVTITPLDDSYWSRRFLYAKRVL